MPGTIGRNSTAIAGMVLAAASSGRRITTPHAPPERCCTMSSAMLPRATPSQKV